MHRVAVRCCRHLLLRDDGTGEHRLTEGRQRRLGIIQTEQLAW